MDGRPETPDKFKRAAAKFKESAMQHVQTVDSSSEEEELEEENILKIVLKEYKNEGKDLRDLDRTREVLEQSFQSGAAICLICIGSVKRIHPIWSCDVCYTAFHLTCIQKWAFGSINNQSDSDFPTMSETVVRVNTNKKIEWCCPKCRTAYPQDQVPQKYQCFCKKKNNPDYQPWLIPHSCGSTCDKLLVPDCGHRCLLLCHPGACPPCPKLITVKCYCGKGAPKPVRCNVKGWFCVKTCDKLLSCKSHNCEEKCHRGDCKPCTKTSIQSCKCGRSEKSRSCDDLEWQCNEVCNRKFECGFHLCKRVCHEDDCGNCPFTGQQTCPCGSIKRIVSCPEEVGTCVSTCNKTLPCGKHMCPNKCHKGTCDQCFKLVKKTCFCGLHSKELPCCKSFFCDTKCKVMKTCGRHACSKKCCNGNCLPCDKTCGKTLGCKKHKCMSTCHSGYCYPCVLNVRVSCRCGQTGYSVPCGHEKKNKPPKCSKLCRIPPNCGHVKENNHKCHFGTCPPCRQRCNKELPCGHQCPAHCHENVPIVLPVPKPAGPWEIQKPKVEIRSLPCPPCKVIVTRPCLGGHEDCHQTCTEARVVSCGRPCGKPLACTNHTCSRECHPFQPAEEDNCKCENCNKSCEFPRPVNCKHPCKKGCHPPPCDQCQQYVKRECHCGLTELYIKCHVITSGEDEENTFSCKQQCKHTLECGHRCSIICHSGPCPTDCVKKSKVRCSCGRIKKDIACNLLKTEEGIVPCDDACEEKKLLQKSMMAEAEMKKMHEEKAKNEREILEFERKFGKRKPREQKNKNRLIEEKRGVWSKYKYFIMSFCVLFGAASFTYFAASL